MSYDTVQRVAIGGTGLVGLDSLNERLIGKDKHVANLTLTNDKTHAELTARTETISVDLAA